MKSKNRMKAFSAILFNAVMGLILAFVMGATPMFGAIAAVGGSALLGGFQPSGACLAGVYREVWTGEMVKQLRAADQATWLDGIPDYSADSENDVIHLVDVGGDPDVLVNNTTYPIPVQDIPDADIAISLDKYQTKATVIKDDQLHAISYDIMGRHVESHKSAITIKKYMKAIHAFAPQTNSAKTPVIPTTGTASNGRKMLTRADIILLKKKFDEMGAPLLGRRLVLCTDHVQDLLGQDQKFADQYHNYTTGKIYDMYGFEIFEYVANPYFTSAGAKVAFGTAPSAGDMQASVAFLVPRMFKCTGTTTFYYNFAENNPTTQQSTMNYRHYFIALPKKQEAIGAIYSAASA